MHIGIIPLLRAFRCIMKLAWNSGQRPATVLKSSEEKTESQGVAGVSKPRKMARFFT
jgi:hypothetical protein